MTYWPVINLLIGQFVRLFFTLQANIKGNPKLVIFRVSYTSI